MASRRRSQVRSYRRKSVFLPYFSLLVILTVLLGIFITTYLVINPKEVRESQATVSNP